MIINVIKTNKINNITKNIVMWMMYVLYSSTRCENIFLIPKGLIIFSLLKSVN